MSKHLQKECPSREEKILLLYTDEGVGGGGGLVRTGL